VADKLTQAAAKSKEQEEATLIAGEVKTHNEYRQKSTIENLRNWEAAKKALEEFRHKKQAEENPEAASFALPEAITYLKEQGWKIEKSKLYEEKQIVGYHTSRGAVAFKKSDLDKYAKKFLKPLSAEDSDSSARKIEAEAKIAEQKYQDMVLDAKIKEGQYILRSDVEQQLAARAAFLKNSLGLDFITLHAVKIAEIIHGNTERIPEFADYWSQIIDQTFDAYSKPMHFEAPVKLMEEK